MEFVHYQGEDKMRINGKEYSVSDFRKLEPNYSAPFGCPTRVYRKGIEHYVTDGSITVLLPKNDPECNRICAREGELARLVALLELEKQKKTN